MTTRHALVHVDDVPYEPIEMPGTTGRSGVRVPVGGRQGSPNACFFARYFPGLTRPKHYHERGAELVFVRSGRGRFGPDGREVRAGHARFIPRAAVHWLTNTSPDAPIELIAFFDGAPSLDETGTVVLGPASEADFHSMPPDEGERAYPSFHLEQIPPVALDGGGMLRPMLGEGCGAGSLLFHLTLPPGAALPRRRHGCDLICGVTRGEGSVLVAGGRAGLRPGHFLYLPGGTGYGLRNGGGGPLECVGVFFGAGSLEGTDTVLLEETPAEP